MPEYKKQFSRTWAATLALNAACWLVFGCTQERLTPDIHSSESQRKIPGIVAAGEVSAAEYAHDLVRSLENDDAAVRLFAIRTLYDWVGEDKGYRYFDPPERRAAAVQAWRAWAETVDEVTPETPGGTVPGQ